MLQPDLKMGHPSCFLGKSSSHYSLPNVVPARPAMSLTSALAFSLWMPVSDPEKLTFKLTFVKISIRSQVSQFSLGYLVLHSQFILCCRLACFGNSISLISQMWWHTLLFQCSGHHRHCKLKASWGYTVRRCS